MEQPSPRLTLIGNVDIFDGKTEKLHYADMILVDGNPLKNLDLVADAEKNSVMIIRDGKIYKDTLG